MGSVKKILALLPPAQMMVALYIVLVLFASSQAYILQVRTAPGEVPTVTKYNNYVIFKYSHFHLLQHKNLYTEYYPEEYWDLFKYSPTFALFFGCFAWFPDWLGLTLWNLLNVVVFFAAIRMLPGISLPAKLWILLLSAPDVMNSMQNSQSNVLVAGLIIMGFAMFERRNIALATLCIAVSFYIKIFGAAAFILVLLYPDKLKTIAFAALWMLLLWVIPVVVIGIHPLLETYGDYLDMLKADHSASLGLSVMGWMYTWFGISLPKTISALAGFAFLCLSLVWWRRFERFPQRVLLFTALMVWMVIFNHKAESPTFIIATSAIFIWFFSQSKSWRTWVMLIFTILFSTLSNTDLFPATIRDGIIDPYVIKVVPCMVVWGLLVFELYKSKKPDQKEFPGNAAKH